MFQTLIDWISENWIKFLSMLTFLTVIPTYLRARYVWRKRQFLTRINFSLNFFDGDTLRFRTIRECDVAHALLNNAHAIRVLLKTARGERPGAFLLFADKEEAWTILNTLLNELSSQFAEGFFARSMAMPTQSQRYYLGLTCEKHGDLKSTKIRLMLVPKQALETIDQRVDVLFEQPHHHIRLMTLKEMWQIARKPELKHNLMEIEVSVKA